MNKIREEDVVALKSSGQFDAQWYVTEYPDVASSGMDPAEHFLWIGAKLGRSPLAPSRPSSTSLRTTAAPVKSISSVTMTEAGGDLDALFIDGTNGTSSTPYRVFRIANGLRVEGWRVRCAKGEDLLTLLQEDIRARFIVIHRAPYWSPFIEFVNKMRAAGSIIVFDVDDLIFDEAVIPHIDGYKYLSEEGKGGFLNGMRAYRDFILNADFCTSPTSYLVDEMRNMGKTAYRVRNAISSENIEFFESIKYRRKGRPAPFVVGYYSGTKTHQADFAVAAPALIQFMQENPEVVFRIVGALDFDDYPELAHWQHVHRAGDLPRVTRVGLMPHDTMVRDQFSCDLIIAPLEVGNPFCEAKSELKFFEASLAQCPVIASSTRTFTEASQDGRLAHLATTTQDWHRSFREIYDNYPFALNRARHAFDHVRNAYSQRFAANEAFDAYEEFEAKRRGLPVAGNDLGTIDSRVADVGVILPDFSGPSGGHRKIFAVCKELERVGKKLKLYFYTNRAPKIIARDIARMFCELDAEVTIFDGDVDDHGYVICTQWKTVYDFRRVPFNGKIINFVQDFEPMFFPVGSDYLRALVSYRLGFEIVCYGEWVCAKLEDELGIKPSFVPFTMDHDVYRPPALEGKRDIDILLFARPSQDRRCFELIMEGLIDLKMRRPDLRIGLFGEDEYEDCGIEIENFGSITDLSELANLYRRTKVGICYSPTNPSQLGYEMVACGAGLIDVRIKFAELNFDGDSFVKYCDGSPEDMARACEELLSDPAALQARRTRGYAYTNAMPGDDQLGVEFIRAAAIA
jgi:glycosyltransferase involved in cell wall biosynthesis